MAAGSEVVYASAAHRMKWQRPPRSRLPWTGVFGSGWVPLCRVCLVFVPPCAVPRFTNQCSAYQGNSEPHGGSTSLGGSRSPFGA